MEKRIHTKKHHDLAWRHYIFHFKWPLFSVLFMISLIVFIQINVSSILVSTLNQDVLELPDTDVIYPVDVINNKEVNTSIKYYLSKKDELKFIDDANTANRQQKIVLPLVENKKNRSSVHLILEYTNVFDRPKFCSHKDVDIFGRTCPYTNWYIFTYVYNLQSCIFFLFFFF